MGCSCAWGHRGRSGRRRRWGGNLIGSLLRAAEGRMEKPRNHTDSGVVAEDGGFEPPRACTQHAFQACAIGH